MQALFHAESYKGNTIDRRNCYTYHYLFLVLKPI